MINSVPIVTAARFQLQVFCHRLWLCLGWTDAERISPQPIDVDLSISLSSKPMACQTDRLEDTFCYASLLETVQEASQAQPIKLLEHLAETLLLAAEQFLFTQGYRGDIIIGVTKVCPPVSGVLGGVRVVCHNIRPSDNL